MGQGVGRDKCLKSNGLPETRNRLRELNVYCQTRDVFEEQQDLATTCRTNLGAEAHVSPATVCAYIASAIDRSGPRAFCGDRGKVPDPLARGRRQSLRQESQPVVRQTVFLPARSGGVPDLPTAELDFEFPILPPALSAWTPIPALVRAPRFPWLSQVLWLPVFRRC